MKLQRRGAKTATVNNMAQSRNGTLSMGRSVYSLVRADLNGVFDKIGYHARRQTKRSLACLRAHLFQFFAGRSKALFDGVIHLLRMIRTESPSRATGLHKFTDCLRVNTAENWQAGRKRFVDHYAPNVH